MTSISSSKEQGGIHVILVSLIVLVLIGTVGYLYWNNFLRASSVKTVASSISGWSTVNDNDIPFKFDYPSTWKIEKTSKSGPLTGTARGGYTLVTLKAINGQANPLTIQYQTGSTGWSRETGPCRSGQQKLADVKIQLDQDDTTQKIAECGDVKSWDYSPSNGKLTWMSFHGTKEIDLSTFKKIVESAQWR